MKPDLPKPDNPLRPLNGHGENATPEHESAVASLSPNLSPASGREERNESLRDFHVNPLLVGLTGGIGSGKTWVADQFAARGASVIDTDSISHQLTGPDGPAIPAIQAAFGASMILPNGAMDRPQMRALVFSDASQKTRLEEILHPMIRDETLRQTINATGLYIIYVIPLLIETGFWHNLSRVLVIDCDEEFQIQRVMRRDGLPKPLIESIIAQQATRTQRLAAATDVIYNQTTLDALIPEIDRLHRLYCQLSLGH